jgi:hypothetical protein
VRCHPARGSSWRRTWSPDREAREDREDREDREARQVREAREARQVREAREDREAREARQVREFSCRLFFPSALGEKKEKKKKEEKQKKKKKKMEGEVLGQANYPYIVLGGSLVMCIAVILMGFKM